MNDRDQSEGRPGARIVLLNFYFSPSVGGIQRYVHELVQASPAIVRAVAPAMRGDDRSIPRPGGAPVPVDRVRCLYERATADTRAYKLLFLPANLMLFFGTLRALWPRRREFDAIVTGSSDFAPVGALVARLLGKSFGTIVHGKDVLPGRRGPLSWYKSRFVMGALRGARAVFCNSEFTAEFARSRGVSPERVRVLHPIVDAENVDPSPAPRLDPELEARAAAASLRLITVARLIERKGTAEILRAMAELARTGDLASRAADGRNASDPRSRVFLFVAGDGPERPRLERLAEELGLRDRVAFLGEIPWGGRIMAHYRLADLCVLPSKVLPGDVETFGMVYVEAALYGLPSIGTRSGGVGDAIADGETGILVEPGEAGVPELARAIGRFLEEPELAREMGERARARAVATFNRERCRRVFEGGMS